LYQIRFLCPAPLEGHIGPMFDDAQEILVAGEEVGEFWPFFGMLDDRAGSRGVDETCRAESVFSLYVVGVRWRRKEKGWVRELVKRLRRGLREKEKGEEEEEKARFENAVFAVFEKLCLEVPRWKLHGPREKVDEICAIFRPRHEYDFLS